MRKLSMAPDLAFLPLRVFVGLSIALAHGWPKLLVPGRMEGFIGVVGAMGFPAPGVFALVAALSELLGGLMIALGLGTRVGAMAVAATMFVAAFVRHSGDPFVRKELALVYFAAAVGFLLFGGGRYALDRVLRR